MTGIYWSDEYIRLPWAEGCVSVRGEMLIH